MRTIKKVNIYLHVRELDGTAYNPKMVWHKKQAVFVEIVDSSNLSGWGECWTFDNSNQALIEYLKSEISPKVIGKPINSITEIWNSIWSTNALSGRSGISATALSAIDIALWDLNAKASKTSIADLINKSIRPVPVYASGGLYKKDQTPEALAKELADYVSNGHTIVKMKTGALAFKDDLERLRAARKAIGDETLLIIDAVYSLDKEKAEHWLPYWEESRVSIIQAPFSPDDWESMQWLNERTNLSVMAYEAESRFEIFRSLLKMNALGIMQFSCIAAGGITGSLKLIELAKEYSIPVSLQCSSTFFAEAVAMQIAASCNNIIHVELHQFHTSFYDLAPKESIYPNMQPGFTQLPSGFGVGFEPPINQIKIVATVDA